MLSLMILFTRVLVPFYFSLGMSFGVRFRVRTFGNKHPDGLNVSIFFFSIGTDHTYHMCIYV